MGYLAKPCQKKKRPYLQLLFKKAQKSTELKQEKFASLLSGPWFLSDYITVISVLRLQSALLHGPEMLYVLSGTQIYSLAVDCLLICPLKYTGSEHACL